MAVSAAPPSTDPRVPVPAPAEAVELRAQVIRVLGAVDPEALGGEQAAGWVRELACIEKVIAATRMFCALRVAESDAWKGEGHASPADWLGKQSGSSVAAARAQLGTARRARRLPRTRRAMEEGRLSPTQAEAVTDGAAADPGAEGDLLGAAQRNTHRALRDEAARRKAAATDGAARRARVRRERSVRTHTDADGAFCLSLRGPAEDGARLVALLRPFEEQAFCTARASGERPTYENRTYDAFMAMLDLLARGAVGKPGAAGVSGSGEPPLRQALAALPRGNNSKVIVLIDHAALTRGHTIAGETCEIPGLGPIPVDAAVDLMQDAFIAAAITKGRDVVRVAHLGRGLSAHQRTAVEATRLRCHNIACNRTVAIQIDHRVPWVLHEETKLDNQDPLCPECHRRKTHHGWHLEPGHGPRRFLPPEPSRVSTGTPEPMARSA